MFEGRDLLTKDKICFRSGFIIIYLQNMQIKGPSLERGIEMYQIGIDKFLGNSLINRLENIKLKTNGELQKRLATE